MDAISYIVKLIDFYFKKISLNKAKSIGQNTCNPIKSFNPCHGMYASSPMWGVVIIAKFDVWGNVRHRMS